MMICLILLHDIVVADLDSHKCRVVNLNDDQLHLGPIFTARITSIFSALVLTPRLTGPQTA